jgi:DNA-binding CsgD family transcriptional regulator
MLIKDHQKKSKENVERTHEKDFCEFVDIDSIAILNHLLRLSQQFTFQIGRDVELICREIVNITDERAKVIISLTRMYSIENGLQSPFYFPLQFHNLTYGVLVVLPDQSYPDRPALSLRIASLLAQVCSLLLHTLEQSVLLQMEGYGVYSQKYIKNMLTAQEKKILRFLCQGCDQQTIADLLCISVKTVKKHRHNIYQKLGVHSKQEAVKVAYLEGLFSPLEEHACALAGPGGGCTESGDHPPGWNQGIC